MCYICVQLNAYVTHGNINVLRLRTAILICNYVTCGQASVKRSYDMYDPYTHVTPVHTWSRGHSETISVTTCFLVCMFLLEQTLMFNVICNVYYYIKKASICLCLLHIY